MHTSVDEHDSLPSEPVSVYLNSFEKRRDGRLYLAAPGPWPPHYEWEP